MFEKIKNMISGAQGERGGQLSYENARAALETRALELRQQLADRDDTPPEMLFFLSSDSDVGVRASIAANPSTPMQANELLVEDDQDDVRMELARKLARLLPDMPEADRRNLRERALTLIQRLADDQVPEIRATLSEVLKDSNEIPPALARKLAKDASKIVSIPMLEFSPLLSDDDLIEVIAGSAAEGAIEAIAKRDSVSANVSDAVATSLDIAAIAALLANPNAQMREETLDRIIDQAQSVEELHKPLVVTPHLSLRAMERIASFVTRAMVELLVTQNDLDPELQSYLREQAEYRLHEAKDVDHLGVDTSKIAEAYESGGLSNDQMTQIAQKGNRPAIVFALSLVADVSTDAVERMISAESTEALVALCWRANLSMRTAHELQKGLHLRSDKIILPRNGLEYPLSEEALKWQLDFFEVPAEQI